MGLDHFCCLSQCFFFLVGSKEHCFFLMLQRMIRNTIDFFLCQMLSSFLIRINQIFVLYMTAQKGKASYIIDGELEEALPEIEFDLIFDKVDSEVSMLEESPFLHLGQLLAG